jgi:glycosyltransferase involved in cell wall biosynthesis
MSHTSISGCVITRNGEHCIEACLRSLAVCDEIVVVDAYSSKPTREIAASLGARVIETDRQGCRAQRQLAVDSARHDWVISLDADERLSDGLAAEIEALKRGRIEARAAYEVALLVSQFGCKAHARDWHPDRHVRLFDRRRAEFADFELRKMVAVRGRIGQLRHGILHEKLGEYASLMGAAMARVEANYLRGKYLRLFVAAPR